MIYEEFTWQNQKKQKIFSRIWKPDTESKAIVILIHGLGEHSGRYEHVANALTNQGFALLTFDLPGHGKSDGLRGHGDFDELVMDIDQLLLEAKQLFPGKPLFLYGHSMGATIALYYISQGKNSVKGVILSGPSFLPGFKIPEWKKLLGKTMYEIYPTLVLTNGLDRSALSHDPEIEKQYTQDPMVHDKISARLGWDIISKGNMLLDQAECLPRIPMLILQGTADRLVNPQAVFEFSERYRGDVRLCKFDGYYHETHNEIGKAEVLQAMHQWLDQKMSE